jgi:putative hydrolase of the HAD superfamily
VARALLLDAAVVGSELVEVARQAHAAGLAIGVAGDTESTVDTEWSLVDGLDETKRLSREYFLAACVALRTAPALCLYVDTDDRAVSAARVAGLSAYRWSGPADLPYVRAALGLA